MKFITLTKYLYPSNRGKWWNQEQYRKVVINCNTITYIKREARESSKEDSTFIYFNNADHIEVVETIEQIEKMIYE